MKKEIGETRIVFVFKKIVIKIPSVRIFTRCSQFFSKKENKLIDKWICPSFSFFFKWFLRGLWCNWSEFVFYLFHPNIKILMPTYFSLFGLINIQRRGMIIKKTDRYIFYQIYKISGHDPDINKDVHLFGEHRNFCSENGRLKIVDYAGELTQKIILKHGEKISREFILNQKQKRRTR